MLEAYHVPPCPDPFGYSFIASCDSEAPPTAPEAYEAISAVANFNGDEDPVFLLFDGTRSARTWRRTPSPKKT